MASRENERKRREWAERLVRSRAGGLTVAQFVASGWIPRHSVLQRIVTQVMLAVIPRVAYMKRLVQQDHAVGIDDTSCRLLLPRTAPVVIRGDLKSQRLAEKVAEAKAKGDSSLIAKMLAF